LSIRLRTGHSLPDDERMTALTRSPLRLLRVVLAFLCAAAAVAATATLAPMTATAGASLGTTRPSAVIGVRVFGHTVQGREMKAYHLGDPKAAVTVVSMAAMHGNERAPQVTLRRLRDGRPIEGVNLWVIPSANPDGAARHDRHNAHAVDLNRNFPTKWRPLTGYYYSGPSPASEPETKALMRFLDRVKPKYVVSFHQPLHGVDTYGTKNPAFARTLAKFLYLPRAKFSCGGVCHGTMTQWYNAHHLGFCVTVEFGAHPSWRYLNVVAPNGLLRAIGGSR
jgi:protein MpaA